jgi:hypothetical protein
VTTNAGTARATRVAASIVLALGVAWLSGCAPGARPVGVLDEGSREARYRRSLAARLERAQGVEADANLWIKPTDGEPLPGMTARLLLAQPDAFRVRVESMFGTALDLAARGDSLDAYVPSQRIGVTIGRAGDSLGVQEPGRLMWRAGSAAWDAPDGAWRAGELRDSVRVVRWTEGPDQIELEVGGSGLPVSVRLRRGAGEVRVRYARWSRVSGVDWPVRVVANDGQGRVEVTWALERVRFRARPGLDQLTVRIPEGSERMTGRDLLHVWENISR